MDVLDPPQGVVFIVGLDPGRILGLVDETSLGVSFPINRIPRESGGAIDVVELLGPKIPTW